MLAAVQIDAGLELLHPWLKHLFHVPGVVSFGVPCSTLRMQTVGYYRDPALS
jgi:hypothetical protein